MIIDLEIRCGKCPLQERPCVPSDGSAKPKIMAIGLAPGASEERMRRSFSGEVGSLVREAIGGIVGNQAYFTNLLKRRPIDKNGVPRKPTIKESNRCGERHLIEEIRAFMPPIIATFGHMPTMFVVGKDIPMKYHGLAIKTDRFGYEFTVFSMYDPGFVVRSGGLNSVVGSEWIEDLKELKQLAERL